MKRLVIVTGARSEWSGLRMIARLAVKSPVFKTRIVAAGMHLLPEFGKTWKEIVADGYRIAYKVYMAGSPAAALGLGTRDFASAFRELKPDLVLVEGDRVEALAATLAAAYMGIEVAHAGGGDITQTIDNPARHSISQFASLHFVSTEGARLRLEAMGIRADTIHVTGSLAIDAIHARKWRSREDTLADLGLPEGSRYLLVAFHPETGHEADANAWMTNILHACFETGLHVVVTYPNSDPGSSGIINALTDYSPVDSLHVFPSLGSDRYLHALRYADALVGNSSSGLYEAPSLCVPVINVGHRQDGRLRAFNVQDCGYGYEEIRKALDCDLAMVKEALGRFEADALAMGVKLVPLNPYGDGHAAKRMLEVIERRLGE